MTPPLICRSLQVTNNEWSLNDLKGIKLHNHTHFRCTIYLGSCLVKQCHPQMIRCSGYITAMWTDSWKDGSESTTQIYHKWVLLKMLTNVNLCMAGKSGGEVRTKQHFMKEGSWNRRFSAYESWGKTNRKESRGIWIAWGLKNLPSWQSTCTTSRPQLAHFYGMTTQTTEWVWPVVFVAVWLNPELFLPLLCGLS